MKYLIHTTVDLKHTKQIANDVTKLYKDFGLDIKFDVKKLDINVSINGLYELTKVWSYLKIQTWWSFKKSILKIFYEDGYDGVCIFIDAKKAPKKVTNSARGLHTQWKNFVGLIEVYSYPKKFIDRNFRNGKLYYDTSNKGIYDHDFYVLVHEIAHNIEYRLGTNNLHKKIQEDNFMPYVEQISKKLIEKNNKKGIVMNQATHRTGQWRLTQPFGVNGVCRKPNGQLEHAIKDGVCPKGSVSIYKYLGLKGHNGLDWASPVGWRMYFNVLNQDNPRMQWTCYTYNSPTYGKKVVAISDEKIFFKVLPKEIKPVDVAQYKTEEGWELYVGVIYLHIGKFKVRSGQKVRHGDVVALTGNSGLSTGPHTHEGLKFTDKYGIALSKDNGYRGAFNHLEYYNM